MNKFKEARMRCGIAQKTVSGKLGVSIQSVSNWENGTRAPSRENVVKMAEMYGVTTDYLLGKDTDDIQLTVETKKESTVSSGRDPRLVQALSGLNEDELQRILDFASGVRSHRAL